MKQRVLDFIHEWNIEHPKFVFLANVVPEIKRPASIEIRYSAARYVDFYSAQVWYRLKGVVEAKSHGTMLVMSSEREFECGMIHINIACANHNYEDRLVIGVLRWIGEEFFPHSDNLNDTRFMAVPGSP